MAKGLHNEEGFSDEDLSGWVERGAAFALTLPSK